MVLIDGNADGALNALDRGLAYGDGVFRTFPMRRGIPLAWRQHYLKLLRDCLVLKLDCPAEAVLREDLARIAHNEPDCAVKIIVTRGPAGRGYAIPQPPPASVRIVLSSPLPSHPATYQRDGIRVRCCSLRLAFQPALAGVKHLNRLENVLARMEWNDPDIAEGLLLDGEGNVIGGTMSNLFILEEGGLVTPELTRCGVEGVTRALVREAAADHEIVCRVERIDMPRLRAAREVFLVNSLIGVWAVREMADRTWPIGGLSKDIRRWVDEKIY
jgi:4-amino-4-deoxychorismate lyase